MIRALGNYGSARHYVFDYLGRNSRIDEIQAAILLAKLPHLDAANQRRKEIAARYEREVSNDLVKLRIVAPEQGPQSDGSASSGSPAQRDAQPSDSPAQRDSVYHIFPVFSPCRDELRQYLLDNGVQTEIHYPIPPHQQRCYQINTPLSSLSSSSLPITELIHAQELSIPCHQALTEDEVSQIISLLNAFKNR